MQRIYAGNCSVSPPLLSWVRPIPFPGCTKPPRKSSAWRKILPEPSWPARSYYYSRRHRPGSYQTTNQTANIHFFA